MKNIISPVSSPTNSTQKRLYNILDDLQVEVRVESNPFQLPLDSLFLMAARKNKKRGFLFVSKLLGKHIPVHATLSLVSGAILGRMYASFAQLGAAALSVDEVRESLTNTAAADKLYRSLMSKKVKVEKPTLFIGFAETATALGHSLFDVFTGEAFFLHTTREQIDGLISQVNFEEEHSHAVAHRCYAENPELFEQASRIVLVDDEMTTGNTTLNFIRALHSTYGQRDFVALSLLDWRGAADRERFGQLERELDIRIRCLSLLEGTIAVKGSPLDSSLLPSVQPAAGEIAFRTHDLSRFFEHFEPPKGKGSAAPHGARYLMHTGRFGLNLPQSEALQRGIALAAEYLAAQRTGRRVLCLGTGEFMYIPMRIASLMGEGVFYQSTTRSPIHPSKGEQYAVTSAYRFDSWDDPGVANYMYNVPPGFYDEAFVFIEREPEEKWRKSFDQALLQTGIPLVHFVVFDEPGGGWQR